MTTPMHSEALKRFLQLPNSRLIQFESLIKQVAINYWFKKGFHFVDLPFIVPASGACENVHTLYQVGRSNGGSMYVDELGNNIPMFLRQTAQLHLEAMLTPNALHTKLFTMGPSFRAEPTVTSRHLTVFDLLEIEFRDPNGNDYVVLLEHIEDFVSSLAAAVCAIPESDRSAFGMPKDVSYLLPAIHNRPYKRIPYADAIAELGLTWGDDIPADGERYFVEKFGNAPVLFILFPNPEHPDMKQRLLNEPQAKLAEKFFNMRENPEDNRYVLSADCITPGAGESVGAAARVYRYDDFQTRLINSRMFRDLEGINPIAAQTGFSWYLHMLKTCGSVPHAGCGFGMSRLMQFLLNERDIRQSVVYPANAELIY